MSDGPSNNRLLIWFSLGHLANDWGPSSIWLIAPAIATAMALSPSDVGLLIAIVTAGAGLGYLPAGILADRVPRCGRLLLATFWWVAIGYGVASLAPGFWSVALLLAIAGLGDAAWHPIATGVLVKALPQRRARALGIHAMGGTFAEVLAPLAVGFLLLHYDWRVALLASAIPAALMGIAFLRIADAVPAATHRAISLADLHALWRTWRSARGLAMIGTISVYNMATMAILAMTPLLLDRSYGLSPAEIGLVFAAMVLAGALIQPAIGHLSDSVGRKPVFIAGNLAAVAACLVVTLAPPLPGLILALVAAITALFGIRSATLAATVEFAGHRESTTLGLAFALLDGVAALGALLAGWAGDFDLFYPFALAAVFAAAAALAALKVGFRAEAPLPAPDPAA